ncbi:aspartyl/asparaginyl beta-hydroxylase domain-containing protein [Nostoc sp. FACHB-152]|uniref:aspartyl/asparaginyl beta-hydroxylase domain-containing protein n=1 Tax=unclassified Nostoc TaxID=2593658 RepID=UPI001684F23F|nr:MULTISPECIES: aspartyl/asparaginyl beta-hydroxylase domain-containing protein [unclassified Nostoc]MBD2450336.1 aspartyl/asparaginyl beta-hydroxylase domain-containing protein [Nostoc sp. FACHB-152]MBD2471760.1 aspartyl/asparaginyl beta-hydroxylase domain-containing protein [Nostoc sp. FACHB-145]
METFNEYHLNPEQFTFLNSLQDNWQVIRDEFTTFIQQASNEEIKFAYDVLGPKSKTIQTKGNSKYSAFGILFQGLFIEEYIQTHQIQYPDHETNEASEKALILRKKYFSNLANAIEKVNFHDDNILRNVYFGTFHPGLDIKLHVNDNPHMNRGYLGLIVPEGDVAMKICHDKLYWHEGKFLILDHSYPHCPHNYTNYDRTVLVVDFFKPDKPREEVIQFEKEQVKQRMQDNPYSLGVFGKSDKAKEEDFIKYGLAHQLEWDKSL